MSKFKVTVEVEVDGDTRKMQWQLAEYLAGGEGCTFFDDYGYGYEAWGGYDGPYAVSVTVKDENGATMTSHANRNKPQEEDNE